MYLNVFIIKQDYHQNKSTRRTQTFGYVDCMLSLHNNTGWQLMHSQSLSGKLVRTLGL